MTPRNWRYSFAFFESFLWHFNKKQRAEVIFRLSRPVSCKNQENGSGKQWSLHAPLKWQMETCLCAFWSGEGARTRRRLEKAMSRKILDSNERCMKKTKRHEPVVLCTTSMYKCSSTICARLHQSALQKSQENAISSFPQKSASWINQFESFKSSTSPSWGWEPSWLSKALLSYTPPSLTDLQTLGPHFSIY